jgi:hypothetical protein
MDTLKAMLNYPISQSTMDANSILKADIADLPVSLDVPENTFVGRRTGEVISALTIPQVQQMIIDPQILYQNNVVMRDGDQTYPNGGTMTGNLYTSWQRVAVNTGQTIALSTSVETSYISVNYDYTSGNQVAFCTLGAGHIDGHRKLLIVSSLPEKTLLQVNLTFVDPLNTEPGYCLLIYTSGQSAYVQWDSVLASWILIGTGCETRTLSGLSELNEDGFTIIEELLR